MNAIVVHPAVANIPILMDPVTVTKWPEIVMDTLRIEAGQVAFTPAVAPTFSIAGIILVGLVSVVVTICIVAFAGMIHDAIQQHVQDSQPARVRRWLVNYARISGLDNKEQLKAIINYRKNWKRIGVKLSMEDAAELWINFHAKEWRHDHQSVWK
jgi:hypothetical protein